MASRKALRALKRHVLVPCRLLGRKYSSTKHPVNIEIPPVPGPDLLIPGFYLTGSFICAKCHYTGKFSAIEDFFPEPKAKDQQIAIAQKREKFQTRKVVQRLDLPSVGPVKDVPDQELNELLNNFSLVIFSDHF